MKNNTEKNFKISQMSRYIAMAGISTALVMAATITLQIPVAGANGYFNLGDSIILVTSVLCGPIVGAIAGGLGSMLADIITGYAIYAIPTLIIKGLEGALCGLIADITYKKLAEKQNKAMIITIGGMTLCGLEMVIGYFFTAWILFGLEIAVVAIPANLMQGGLSVVVASLALYAFKLHSKIKFIR